MHIHCVTINNVQNIYFKFFKLFFLYVKQRNTLENLKNNIDLLIKQTRTCVVAYTKSAASYVVFKKSLLKYNIHNIYFQSSFPISLDACTKYLS